MATRHSDLEGNDLETDDFHHNIARAMPQYEPVGKSSAENRDPDRNDSGFGSGSLPSGTSEKLSLSQVDKTPIQCSDAADEDDVCAIEEKFTGLHLSDEAFCSMPSSGSNTGESIVTQESDEKDQDIYIDLNEQDYDGDTVLHIAIVSLFFESALILIELCDDVESLNIQNHLRQSALHLAVLTDQPEIVRALVAKGVDVTLRDQQGNTPLHIACRMGNTDAVSAIVKCMTDLNTRQKYFSVRNNEGLTCMHLAVLAKEYIILGHLLAKGADVNIGDAKSGRTMLHYAVERKDLETVTLLLTHKDIDVDRRTFKGESPIVLAFWRNYQDIVRKLRSNGAYFDYSIVEDSDDECSS